MGGVGEVGMGEGGRVCSVRSMAEGMEGALMRTRFVFLL